MCEELEMNTPEELEDECACCEESEGCEEECACGSKWKRRFVLIAGITVGLAIVAAVVAFFMNRDE